MFGPLSHLNKWLCSRKCKGELQSKTPSPKRGKVYEHLQRAGVRNCSVCGKEFRATKDHKNYKQKRCSRECYTKDWIEKVRPNMKDNPGVKGEKNYAWKGENAGYHALHHWVARELGKPKECWRCGDTSERKYEWASLNHEYKRDTSNWVRLCTPCHRYIDTIENDILNGTWQKKQVENK